jgi:hypothetical protein
MPVNGLPTELTMPWSLCTLHFALHVPTDLPTSVRVLELQRHQGTNVPRSPIRVSRFRGQFTQSAPAMRYRALLTLTTDYRPTGRHVTSPFVTIMKTSSNVGSFSAKLLIFTLARVRSSSSSADCAASASSSIVAV